MERENWINIPCQNFISDENKIWFWNFLFREQLNKKQLWNYFQALRPSIFDPLRACQYCIHWQEILPQYWSVYILIILSRDIRPKKPILGQYECFIWNISNVRQILAKYYFTFQIFLMLCYYWVNFTLEIFLMQYQY